MTGQSGAVTLINVFTCAPERQDELVRLLQGLTDEVMRSLPGFLSASIHRGLDGKHVANYAQWESEASWKAMVRDPRVQARMAPVVAIATFQPHLYEMVETYEAS